MAYSIHDPSGRIVDLQRRADLLANMTVDRGCTTAEAETAAAARAKLLQLIVELQAGGSAGAVDWSAADVAAYVLDRLTPFNQAMIIMQMPGAVAVAGYRQWQAAGRQVVKGSRALRILVPRWRKGSDPKRDDPDYFAEAAVFDVSQTVAAGAAAGQSKSAPIDPARITCRGGA